MKGMTFHVLGVPTEDLRFETNHILRVIIRWTASVGSYDWSVAYSAGKSMHGQF